MHAMSYLAFFFFLVGLVIAGYALWADALSSRHRAMSIAGALFALWSLSMVPMYGADSMQLALLWYKISLAGVLFLIPAVYWIYLDQAHLSSVWVWGSTGFLVAVGLGLYGSFWFDGFHFTSFRTGVWGNVGVAGGPTFMNTVAAVFYSISNLAMVSLMFWCRHQASTVRERRLYGANAGGLILSAVVFGVAFSLEEHGWPPLDMVAVGVYFVGVNLYMAGRYGYLVRETVLSTPLIQDQVKDPLFVLKPDRTVASLNTAAKTLLNQRNALGVPFEQLFETDPPVAEIFTLASRSDRLEFNATAAHGDKTLGMTIALQKDRFADVNGAVVCLNAPSPKPQFDPTKLISPREKEILDLVIHGYANKTIADTLFISLGTVKTHLYNIYKKLGVESRLELMNKMRDQDA